MGVLRKCLFCSEAFSSGKSRRRHVHRTHGPLPDFCSACEEPFLSTRALTQHNRQKHGSSISHPQEIRSLDALTSADNLDVFVAITVQPDDAFLSKCNSTVDKIVRILQSNVKGSLKPSRVIKGGSLGKGTAVKGKSDIDLVLMLKKYRDVRSLESNLETIINSLKSYLNKARGINVTGTTPYCVKLEYTHRSGEKLAIDVLPAVDCLEINGNVQVFEMMRVTDSDLRRFYSPSLTPLQVKLFSSLPTKLKSLIRLVKYWKKGQHSASQWPTSYVLELVTLAAWTKAGSPMSFDMKNGLHAVLDSIIQHNSFAEDFNQHSVYDKSDLGLPRLSKPYIMDPCNPFNNVYLKPYQGAAWDWGSMACAASETIDMPLFAGVTRSWDWQ